MEKVKLNRHFISDIFFYQEGPGVRKWQFKDSGVKLINVGNINNGKIDLSSTKINISEEEAYGKYSHFLIDEGDLLIACSGIVVENFHNKIAFIKKEHLPLCLNTSTMRFKELPDKKGDLNFLKYFLQTNDFKSQLRKLITGSAQLNFGPSHIRKIEIPLPPLATQQKIAAILDQADAIIQNNRAIVQKYDALTQSLFLDMFGDPVKNEKGWEKDILGNHCSKIQIGPFGSQLHLSDYVENGIPLVNPTNIKKDSIDYNNSVKITEEKYNSLPNYHLKNNDVIMSRRGDLSKIGIVNKEKSFCGTGSLFLRLKNTLNPLFCYFMLSHKSTIDVLYEKAQGITMPNLNKNIIVNIRILIPSSDLQTQFAERLAVIEEQKQQAQLELAKSEELFQSLLQRAFKGELS